MKEAGDSADERELNVVKAWFKRHGLDLTFERASDEWYATPTKLTGGPTRELYVTGRGQTQLEAAEDAKAFLSKRSAGGGA